MTFSAAGSRPNSLVMRSCFALAGFSFLLNASGGALAAPGGDAGCTTVNSGVLNTSLSSNNTDTRTVTGFSIGDRITFTLTGTLSGTADQWWASKVGGVGIITSAQYTNGTVTRTVTIDGPEGIKSVLRKQNGTPDTISVTATCVAAPPPVVGPTDSDKIRGVQVQGSMQAASASGAAITDAVSGATSDAFANGGSPITMGPGGIVMNFAAEPEARLADDRRNAGALEALAYAGEVTKAPRSAPALEKQWSLWANIRGSGFDRINSSAIDMRGTQLNATAGVGYKINPNVLIGAFAGYESFTYDFASLNGRLKGDGGTIGGYAGWKITPSLRWDVMAGWSGLSYDASAGTASGTFSGSRWIASTGLTGTHRVAGFTLEPSVKVFTLWEHQKDWTDSLGVLQTARDFTTGRVSAGGRVLTPAGEVASIKITPFVGFYGDWRFSSEDALPAAVDQVGLNKGWSGRVTGGVNIASAGGASLGLSGEYGGLGADYGIWTANLRARWPF